MSARCDLSDLLVDECGCRIHAPAADRSAQRAKPTPEAGPSFYARYGGKCAVCGGRIYEGEPVRLQADELVHDGCEV